MNLLDLVNRPIPPAPWSEGEKIPWNEPAFSARMLREHLSQEHDAASRRAAIIDRQVDWIFNTPLGKANLARSLTWAADPASTAAAWPASVVAAPASTSPPLHRVCPPAGSIGRFRLRIH